MRVAIAIERFDPFASGIERSTHQIARHLISRGHHITILCGEAPPDFVLEGGQIVSGHTVDFRHRVSVSAFARWAPDALAQQQADVTLSMTMACPAMVVQPRGGVIAERIERETAARGGATTLRQRAAQWLNLPRQAGLRRERATAANPMVKRFVAISKYVKEQLQKHHAISEDRIAMIPNGAELPALDVERRAEARRRVRQAFRIDDDSTALLFLAQHSPRLKGIEPLLRATEKLVKQGRNVTLLLAGHITYPQQMLAAKLGIRDRIRMVGPTNEIAQLIAATDLTVMPSYFDPSSKIVIESLMMSVPVVTSRFNGACDFVIAEDGRPRGRIVEDPADVDAVASAIDALIDPAERGRCIAAMAGLDAELSMSKHVDALENLLSHVAESS